MPSGTLDDVLRRADVAPMIFTDDSSRVAEPDLDVPKAPALKPGPATTA